MWATILFLVLLFVAGFISTNFPRKKLLAWFQSLWVEIRDPSGVAPAPAPATKYETLPVPDGQRKAVKTSDKVQLRGVFATFDKNNDGYITKQELRDSLRNIGMAMSEKDVDDMIRRVDSNGDGLIDLDEFCESFDSLLGRGETNKEEPERDGDGDGADEAEADGGDGDLKEAFDVFDGDKDGVITVEELGLVLSSLGFKEGRKLEDCKEMIRKVDMDGDGMVNFEEFKKMMKAGHKLVRIS